MEPGIIFEWVSKLGALGVALLALKWARDDNAKYAAAFEKLNEERKTLQIRANDVIEKISIETAILKDKVATLITTIHDLSNTVRDNKD